MNRKAGRHARHSITLKIPLPSRRAVATTLCACLAAGVTYIEQRYGTTLFVLIATVASMSKASQ